MSGDPGLSFAALLRLLRLQARLTQEELAQSADISTRAVSDLERGVNRTAHKETARLLAAALGLPGPASELFVAAARGRVSAREVLAARNGGEPWAFAAAATRGLPRDVASFTGRQSELDRILATIADLAFGGGVTGIHAIDGMAGIGKTTFAVHAAHRLAGHFPDGQFFLPLHAHTPGQRPVDPADALASLLLSAGLPSQLVPPGLQARSVRWRDHVAGKKILLLLDDAAGHDQVTPLLPGTAGSLVLITSRRRLTALPDAAVISLATLPPAEAAVLLARLARRADISAGDPSVSELARLCGHLPLAIGMLAAQLRHHPAWTPAGLASDLAQSADRLAAMRAEDVSIAAMFDLSYAELTPAQGRLFRRLGLVPGPDIDTYAAAALDGTSREQVRLELDALYGHHLLSEPAQGRYQLHDLLREHARAKAEAGDRDDARAAVGRLLDYYLHTAAVAARLTTRRPPAIPPVSCLPPAVPPLASRKEAEAWLRAERPNLHACAKHAAASGSAVHAVWIPAQLGEFLRSHGYLDQALSLHQTAASTAQAAGDRAGQAAALYDLGRIYRALGPVPAAIRAFTQALRLYRDLGDKSRQVEAINFLGTSQCMIDDRVAAQASLTEGLALARELEDLVGQANALDPLATIQMGQGSYQAAAALFSECMILRQEAGDQPGRARELTIIGHLQTQMGDYELAVTSLTESIAMSRDLGDPLYEAVALTRLAYVQRLAGDYDGAQASLTRSLTLARELGSRVHESEALMNLGALQHAKGHHQAARASLKKALTMYRENGDLTSQAETLNYLGEVQATLSGPQAGLPHYTEALSIARDVGSPLEEADALAGIGRCHLEVGNAAAGTAFLEQALNIYQRIGSPNRQLVEKLLGQHIAK